MIIFSEVMKIARSIPPMIALYLASLLEVGKSKCLVCSITSPVGALSVSPSPAPVCREGHPHSESTSRSCLVPFPVKEFMLKSQLVPTPLTPSEVYIEYRTHSVQLPIEPFVMTGRAYV